MTDYIDHGSFSTSSAECFAIFNEHRKTNELCDVAILASEKKLNAHKLVLSSASPYFRKMFTLPLLEADMKEISIPDISYKTWEQILNFIYTGKMSISTETAQNILSAANFLQLITLVDLCGKYIVSRIDDTNCFSMRDLLISTNCDKKIIARASDYINANFLRISQNKSFLQLDINSAVELLSSSELYCYSEEDIFHAAIRWLNAENGIKQYVQQYPMRWLDATNDAKRYSQQIYNCIRLALLSNIFVTKKSKHLNQNILSNDPLSNTYRKFETSILGIQWRNATCLELYDSSSKNWKKVETLLDNCKSNRFTTMASNNGKLFVARVKLTTNTRFFDILDLQTKQWTSLPSLPNGVAFVSNSIHIVNKKLYVFGGSSDRFKFDVFDFTTNSWSDGLEMENRYRASKYISLDEEIYAIRNLRDAERKCQKFDSKTETWLEMEPVVLNTMKKACFVGKAAFKSKIYLVGFYNVPEPIGTLNIFEMYDPSTNEWKELTPMMTNMCGPTLVATRDGIYAIGREITTERKIMEFYNVEEDKWSVEGYCPEEFREHFLYACSVPSFYFP